MTYDELEAGNWIKLRGFTCAGEGEARQIERAHGEFFIRCSHGKHFLSGQLADDNETLIGVEPCEAPRHDP
jgi:hypothetical protein